jgi:hypothetical protein
MGRCIIGSFHLDYSQINVFGSKQIAALSGSVCRCAKLNILAPTLAFLGCDQMRILGYHVSAFEAQRTVSRKVQKA